MNKFNLYYKEDITQRQMDIICGYLRSFGQLISQSTRNCYLVFQTDLNKQQIETRIKGMRNIIKVEINEN